MDGELDNEEKLALLEMMDKYGATSQEQKFNVHTFLNEVLKTSDTTKVGFLNEIELGQSTHSARTFIEMALYSEKIIDNPLFTSFFGMSAEKIVFAPSLSRNGKLITLAVTQKRSVADDTKPKTVNKGWFKSKDKK